MLALLSDLHANVQALQACLQHARDRGASRFAILGDIVGYGGEPAAVVDMVRELHSRGAVVLKGNHDALAVNPPPEARSYGAQTAGWTHEQLDGDQRGFLDGLPLSAVDGTVLLVHASADKPAAWTYVDNPRKATASLAAASATAEGAAICHVFGGHVHHQHLYYRGRDRHLVAFRPTPGVAVPVPDHRQWLATVGSVGQPRDGDPRAMYALMDLQRQRLTFHRVAYDHYAAARAVRRAGLPDGLAHRLEVGR